MVIAVQLSKDDFVSLNGTSNNGVAEVDVDFLLKKPAKSAV